MNRKICVVTGSRAEYGILSRFLGLLNQHPAFSLSLIVTGSHLSDEFGDTRQEISPELEIFKEIDILSSENSEISVCRSMGTAITKIGSALSELKPDLILLLGDRYEIFASASAANILGIPIAHLHGGEVTEGSFDEAMRHSITKMSHLHFTSTETYRKRVIQLGEHPSRVWNVGALGVENISHMRLLSREDLEKQLSISLETSPYLVTFHPETKSLNETESQFNELIKALSKLDTPVIFTYSNSDPLGQQINKTIEKVVSSSTNWTCFKSLGNQKYLSLLPFSKAAIGNSSSGIIEAPSFHIPTINIGQRQKGRVTSKSVLHCCHQSDDIYSTILKSQTEHFLKDIAQLENPYKKKGTASKIIQILQNFDLNILSAKTFYDLT